MGLLANYPIAMAPAMGENFFFLTVVVEAGARTGLARLRGSCPPWARCSSFGTP